MSTPPKSELRQRALAGFLRVTAAGGGAFGVVGLVSLVAGGHGAVLWSQVSWVFVLFAVFFAVGVWMVAPRQFDNAVVWVMTASGFSGGLWIAGLAGAAWVADDPSLIVSHGESVIPASLSPTAAAWIMLLTYPAVMLTLGLPLTFGLLLFPDGRLPSYRWRWVGRLNGVALFVLTVGFAWGFRPGSTVPADDGLPLEAGFLLTLAAVIASLAALVVRFRRRTGTIRQQFKWVGWGASIFGMAVVAGAIFGGTEHEDLILVPFAVGTLAFLLSYAIAVGKYRLFDIDIVVNRTVMVGALAVIIVALYVGVIVGVGRLLGSRDETQYGVQVAATVVVAIAFGPARRRAQQWANRAVYGERATPYEVLARFSHRAAEASEDELLARTPQLVVDGTGAAAAALWVASDDVFRIVATSPERSDRREIPLGDSFADPDADYSLPVFHDGELLGGLSLVTPRGETLPPAAEQLVANLAAGMGLALRNTRLTTELRVQVAELEASRERILAADDEARRSLERDLDSGPQQQLVALKVMLGPIRKQALQAGAAKTAEVLGQLESSAGEAIRAVREFSGGVYPPLLEAEGLTVAIMQQAENAALPTAVAADGLGRYAREVEAAVYFTILEALQNIAKYAHASTVSIVLNDESGELRFEVTDDGAGFDLASTAAGSGLSNMSDRLDAVGGRWSLETAPGSGTTVRGHVPILDRLRVNH